MQVPSTSYRTNLCPPHTPLIAQVTQDGCCEVRCLACGLLGPERENYSKAWRAFREVSKSLE